MQTALGLWWQPCPGGARLLRAAGDTPCPVLPADVEGLPITELGPYCFSARERPLPPEARHSGPCEGPVLRGSFLEEITLPPALRTLHSAVFYDCRRLRRLTLGPAVTALGSDLFTNCRALDTLVLCAAPGTATGLERLLRALSADLTVLFIEQGQVRLRLFYPEYSEFLDENMPAHLFNRGIEGEGYRYRQCFIQGAVDLAAYDAVFERAAIGEPPAKLCRLALGRLLCPTGLDTAARARYEGYLRLQLPAALALAVDGRETAALRLLGGLGLDPAKAAAACAAAGWSAGVGALFGARPAAGRKRYDFDDL